MVKAKVKKTKKTSPSVPAVSFPLEQRRMGEILKILKREYPEAKCSLNYRNPFELMIATILSAQCTDERVNKTTPELFKKYPSPAAMAAGKLKDIEKLIQSCGFFR